MKLKEVIGERQERFQVNEDFTHQRSESYFVDQRRLANICGFVACALPVVLWLSQTGTGGLRHSISHY